MGNLQLYLQSNLPNARLSESDSSLAHYFSWVAGGPPSEEENLGGGQEDRHLPVEFVDVWEISGLLSLLEVDWALGWTWMAWNCWGTPAPAERERESRGLGSQTGSGCGSS